MKIKNIYLTIALVLIGFGLVTATPQVKQEREAIPAGGGSAQSNSFKNFSTVGEPVVGSHSSANFSGTTGFLFDGTVPQEAIIVNANQPYEKTYGDAKFTVTYTGGSGTGAVSYSSDHEDVATIDAGTGEVTIVGFGTAILTVTKAAEPGKYVQQTGTATLTVGKAPLTVTTNSVETCKGTIPTFTAAFSGFVNGETETTLGIVGLTFTDNNCNTPGTYDITPSGLTAAGYNNYAIAYTKGTLTVDATTLAGDNPVNVLAKVGDVKTFTTANGEGTIKWQVSTNAGVDWSYINPAVTTPVLTLSGITAEMDGNQYRAEFKSGVCEAVYTAAATLSVDAQVPTLTAVAIVSNNTTNTLAKVGNIITLTFTSSETISEPTVKIAGHIIDAANVTNSGNVWTATYSMIGTDSEGNVGFEISNFADNAGNAGLAVSATTLPVTSVTFDRTAPSGYTVAFDQAVINSGNVASASITVSKLTTDEGGTINYTISGTSGVPITGTSTIAANATSATINLATLAGLAEGTLTATVTITDAAGNTGVNASDDVTKTATEFTLNTMVVNASGKLELTFNRNVGVSGNTNTNYTLSGSSTPGSFTNGYSVSSALVSGSKVTLTINGANNSILDLNLVTAFPQCSTLTINVANVKDNSDNTISSSKNAKSIVNTTVIAPAVAGITRMTPTVANTNLTQVTFKVQFDKDVTRSLNGTSTAVLDAGNFNLVASGSAIGNIQSIVSANGTAVDDEWHIVVNNISGVGTLKLVLDNPNYIYAVACGGQPAIVMTSTYTNSESYSVDNSAPTVSSWLYTVDNTPVTRVRANQLVKVAVKFNEALSSTSSVKLSQTVGTIISPINMTYESATDSYYYIWTVPIGDFTSSFTVSGGVDLAGNSMSNTGATNSTVIVDNTLPTITSFTNNIDGRLQVRDADLVTLTVQFDEPVTSPKITIINAGITNQPLATGTEANQFTFLWDVNNGNYTANVYVTATDAAGNSFASNSLATYVVDNIAPTVVIAASPDKSAYTGLGSTPNSVTFTATFTEANSINEVTAPPRISISKAGVYYLTSGAGNNLNYGVMSKSGTNNKVWTYTWTVPSTANITVDAAAVTIVASDLSGNAVGTHSGKTTVNITNQTPVISSIVWTSTDARLNNYTNLQATTAGVSNADTVEYYLRINNNVDATADLNATWIKVAKTATGQLITGITAATLVDGPIYIRARVRDLSGNISSVVTSEMITKDITAPVASTYSPSNITTAPLSGNLVITFNENITSGTGNVYIYNANTGVVAKTLSVTSVSGNSATIAYDGLVNNTQYYVTMANAAVKDSYDNSFAGFTSSNIWKFTTVAPTSKLSTVVLNQASKYVEFTFDASAYSATNATGLLTANNFTLSYVAGKQGNLGAITDLALRNDNGGTTLVLGATKYRLYYNYTGSATGAEQIIVDISNIYNANGIPVATNLTPEQRTLTLADEQVPVITTYLPAQAEVDIDHDADQPVTLTFNVNMQVGVAGNILVKKLADDQVVQTISNWVINGANAKQLTFTIDKASIEPSTTYYITIPAGLVKTTSSGAISFAGITSPNTYQFTTSAPVVSNIPANPTITYYSRSKNSITYNVNYGTATGALVVMTYDYTNNVVQYADGTPTAAPSGTVSTAIATSDATVSGVDAPGTDDVLKVVQYGSATSVTITGLNVGLTGGKAHYFKAWAYNIVTGDPVYSTGTGIFNYATSTRKDASEGWVEIPEFNGSFDISQVYPNPTTDAINFKVIADETQEFTYELVTMSGQSILTSKEVLTAGQHDVKLNLNGAEIASGSYTLIVRSGSDYLWQQVSIVK